MIELTETADQIFKRVLDDPGYDRRLKTSLQRIKAACDTLAQEASLNVRNGVRYSRHPIYVTSVGRKCVELFGGPTPESITRNQSKEPLKHLYITLRAQELLLPGPVRENDPLSKVMPPALRSYISSLEEKIRLQERFITGMTASLKKITPVSLESIISQSTALTSAKEKMAVETPDPRRTAHQKAVAKLLDPTHLKKFGLMLDQDYLIDSTTGEEFLKPDEIAALKSALTGYIPD